MLKNSLKILCCMIVCWVVCVPVFCQVAQSMSPDESREARQKLLAYSKQFVGVPYQYGGASWSGMDCSGFTFTVANDALGIKLPRSTSGLYAAVRIIDDSEKEPGDLLFFKTVGSRISHVGLYLGNNQFIHAASDGPNTGVIISSLNESYWKRTYAGPGRFLPATGEKQPALETEPVPVSDRSSPNGTNSGAGLASGGENARSGSGGSSRASSGGFLSRLSIDGTLTGDWTFFSATRFHLISRGATLDAHARYTGGSLEPGFGLSLSWDPAMRLFQIPVLFSLTVLEGIRVYAGPVFTMGNPVEPSTESPVKGSIFPGVLGLCLQTPTLKAGKVELSLVQDIRYTVFNNTKGSALSFLDSMASGLVFSTGIRVTFPLANFI